MSVKVGVVSLGCDKNRVDTEVMLNNLQVGGYEITSKPEEADVIIVNTCAFLESARKEAIDTVFEMLHFKQHGKCKKVIVTGCLGQKFGKEVFDELYEVDTVVGTQDYDDICAIVGNTLQGDRRLYNSCNNVVTFGDRVLTTPKHYAYIKIADGCDNYCTYCLIPYIRGRFRSVPMQQIVAQAQKLADGGVTELILVAQDVTKYGKDLYGELRLVQLLRELSAIDGLKWIRLLYCYPELMTDELIEEISTNDKIVKYVDIPLQHVNTQILKKMNRKSDYDSIVNLFNKLTRRGINIRSTFICGFPGETQESIAQLQNFLSTYKLRNVGFFAYSCEEGTPASKFDGQIADNVKEEYLQKLYFTQHEVAQQLNVCTIGKTLQVVVDEFVEKSDGYYTYRGRTEFMCPDIDGCVYVTATHQLEQGQYVDVLVTDAMEYDLIGEVTNESSK